MQDRTGIVLPLGTDDDVLPDHRTHQPKKTDETVDGLVLDHLPEVEVELDRCAPTEEKVHLHPVARPHRKGLSYAARSGSDCAGPRSTPESVAQGSNVGVGGTDDLPVRQDQRREIIGFLEGPTKRGSGDSIVHSVTLSTRSAERKAFAKNVSSRSRRSITFGEPRRSITCTAGGKHFDLWDALQSLLQ